MIASLKRSIKALLPWKVLWALKRFREEWQVLFAENNLNRLAEIYQTDKYGHHYFTPIYQQWFSHLHNAPVRLLEIGIGRNENPLDGGNSLRMWKSYFPKGTITGIDIFDKSALKESRIHIYQGDQADKLFLEEVTAKEGPFDIIVDDGSHMQSHIITSFETLFPLLSPGGFYVIEDTLTSYLPQYEGSLKEMHTTPSSMNYFRDLIHEVNRKDSWPTDLQNQASGFQITSIAFYHNLILIEKRSKAEL